MYNEVTTAEKNALLDIIEEMESGYGTEYVESQFEEDMKKMNEEKNKGGRPRVENKKKTTSFRVSDEIKAWIDSQDESAGVYIEFLILEDMRKRGANNAN